MTMHFEKAEIVHPILFKRPEGELGADWHVFDDDVCVDLNVSHAGNAFSLRVAPAGEVRVLILSDAKAPGIHDCPEYEKCFTEFGNNNIGWCCSNCAFDPEAPNDNEAVILCELRLNLVKAGRNIAKLFE